MVNYFSQLQSQGLAKSLFAAHQPFLKDFVEQKKSKIAFLGTFHNTSWVLQPVNKKNIVFFYYNCNYKFMLMIT